MNNEFARQRISFEGLEIVRLYPSDEMLMEYPRIKLNRNVEAYSPSGELVWIIEECSVGGTDEDKPYMNIFIKNGQLIASNWIGLDFVVNLENGKIRPEKIGVRPW